VRHKEIAIVNTEKEKLTFRENVIATIKVLLGFGLLGAALWVVDLWKSAS
jgi:O-antigen/teichoic acid export membrane protein